MKKRLLGLLLAVATVMSFVGLTGCSSAQKAPKIGIVQFVENGAFNDMKSGIIEELKANGYTDDQIVYQCAQGDASTMQTIAQNMSDGSYAAIFTIATPTTQAFVNLESKTPTFFCSVSAPVAAGILTDMAKPDKNATGTSNAIPIGDIFGLCDELTPGAKTFGFLYCNSEDNSVNTVKQAKAYCDENGLNYEEISVTNSSEVQLAIEALVEKVDVVFIPNDSVVQSAFDSVTEVTRNAKIPVYASSATTVLSGAFATVAISDIGIGKETAKMGLKYLKDGVKVEDIPAIVVPAQATVVNEDTMNALGVSLTDDQKANITFLKDNK